MSKLLIAVKDEIRRVARKEIRLTTAGLKKDRTLLRKSVVELRRQLKAHSKTLAQLLHAAARQAKVAVQMPATAEARKARLTAKGVRALRRKLTQRDFGKLIGVGGQTVLNWEHGAGPLKVRSRTKGALLAVRGLGIREARLRLKMFAPRRPRRRAKG